jgi:hypothetical protein
MSMAGFDDVRRLEQLLGCDLLADVMLQAEPGWIDDRSWEFWCGRLMRATGRKIPDTPPVRSFLRSEPDLSKVTDPINPP